MCSNDVAKAYLSKTGNGPDFTFELSRGHFNLHYQSTGLTLSEDYKFDSMGLSTASN